MIRLLTGLGLKSVLTVCLYLCLICVGSLSAQTPRLSDGILAWEQAPDAPQVEAALLLKPGLAKPFLLQAFKDYGWQITDDSALPDWCTARLTATQLADLPDWVVFAEINTTVRGYENSGNMVIQGSVWLQQTPLLPLTGAGVYIALGDDGALVPHLDLTGRVFQNGNDGASNGLHGELMAGIIAGAGNRIELYKGAAPHSLLHIETDLGAVKKGAENFIDKGIALTNTTLSEDCNRGYTTLSALADRQIQQFGGLMHIFSAGNLGQYNCQYGAGIGWGNLSGGTKTCKNGLTVGNAHYNMSLYPTSSRGPTADGRIKPDLVAVGWATSLAPNNAYETTIGTSPAAAATAGAWAQLSEGCNLLWPGQLVDVALVKAALLNTTLDIDQTGPDFRSGWGMIRADRAWEVIQNQKFAEANVAHGQTQTINIAVPPGAHTARVMVYWNDPEGLPTAQHVLVNDLDLHLSAASQTYLPWRLRPHPDSVHLPATTGYDRINNVEQVVLPVSGLTDMEAVVHGYAVSSAPQRSVVVWYFEYPLLALKAPRDSSVFTSNQKISLIWDVAQNNNGTVVEMSFNQGQSWSFLENSTTGTAVVTHQTDTLAEVWVRVVKEGYNDKRVLFIAPEVGYPQIGSICPDSFVVSWSPVAGATAYQVEQLVGGHIKPVWVTGDTTVKLGASQIFSPQWVAVRPIYANGVAGARSVAVEAIFVPGTCPPQKDLSVSTLTVPVQQSLQACFAGTHDLGVLLQSGGLSLNGSYQVKVSVNDQLLADTTLTNPYPANLTLPLTFHGLLPPLPVGAHAIRVWVEHPADEAHYNDTLTTVLTILPTPLVGLPSVENVDQLITSDQVTVCQGVSNSGSYWFNQVSTDNPDSWHVVEPGSVSGLSLPDSDYNANHKQGRAYLLRNQPSCNLAKAALLGPCVDLSNSAVPRFTVWALFGGQVGERIHVDLFNGSAWVNNIATLQGHTVEPETWVPVHIDLTPWLGQTVSVRLRGRTGIHEQSFILIDKPAFWGEDLPPIADFGQSATTACVGMPVELISHSINSTGVKWTILPADAQFVNNTTDTSQVATVVFSEPGVYQIQLLATNALGQNEFIRLSAIEIKGGSLPPLSNGFESSSLLPEWQITVVNPDQSVTWQTRQVPGFVTESTKAIWIDNHSYAQTGREDHIVMDLVRLPNGVPMSLSFDVAYAPHSLGYNDKLTVALSTDCGESFSEVLFEAQSQDLATAPAKTTAFAPAGWKQWKRHVLSLDAYPGQVVQVRFTNQTAYGNNVYLDNLLVGATQALLPDVDLTHPDTVCTGTTLAASAEAPLLTSGFWQFGTDWSALHSGYSYEGAAPDSVGWLDWRWVGCSPYGCFSYDVPVWIEKTPVAKFWHQEDGQTVQFVNESTGAQSWLWHFGTGDVSGQWSPAYTYPAVGTYPVLLELSGACGYSTVTKWIEVDGVNMAGDALSQVRVYPNPVSGGWLVAEVGSGLGAQLVLTDAAGRQVGAFALHEPAALIDVAGLALGVYYYSVVDRWGKLVARGRLVVVE